MMIPSITQLLRKTIPMSPFARRFSVSRLISGINTSAKECVKINSVIRKQGENMLRVSWSDSTSNEFPLLFLRDNCQCSVCFHPDFKERTLGLNILSDFDLDAKAFDYDFSSDSLRIKWPDDHWSVFDGSWLKERKFPSSWDEAEPSTTHGIPAITWSSSDMEGNLPFINYKQLMTSDQVLLHHIENLATHGLSIIEGAPAEYGVLKDLIGRVSYKYCRMTTCGESFSVKSKPSPINTAYTSEAFGLHTDFPWYANPPQILHLHCIEQSGGQHCGTSMLVDGFRAAEELRQMNPQHFELLAKANFKFGDEGKEAFGKINLQVEKPVIGFNSFGRVDNIRYSEYGRSSFINAPSHDILNCYKAYYEFTQIIKSDVMQYKMRPGDIITLNNMRLLHGRTGFDAATSSRWIEGAYTDWDEVWSKYRVVKESMSQR